METWHGARAARFWFYINEEALGESLIVYRANAAEPTDRADDAPPERTLDGWWLWIALPRAGALERSEMLCALVAVLRADTVHYDHYLCAQTLRERHQSQPHMGAAMPLLHAARNRSLAAALWQSRAFWSKLPLAVWRLVRAELRSVLGDRRCSGAYRLVLSPYFQETWLPAADCDHAMSSTPEPRRLGALVDGDALFVLWFGDDVACATCPVCGVAEVRRWPARTYHSAHVWARARGGLNDMPWNRVPVCMACNLRMAQHNLLWFAWYDERLAVATRARRVTALVRRLLDVYVACHPRARLPTRTVDAVRALYGTRSDTNTGGKNDGGVRGRHFWAHCERMDAPGVR